MIARLLMGLLPIVFVITGFILCLKGVEGWGWFLGGALATSISSIEARPDKK